MKENEIHVSTEVIKAHKEEVYKFKLPYNASLLEVLQKGAHLASVKLLPNPEKPLDRLHVMLNHHEVGHLIEDIQKPVGEFVEHHHGENHFGIELVLAFRVNTRWGVAPKHELSPRQILELFGMDYQEYTLYSEKSDIPLPLDTMILIVRGMVFEAQKNGKYGGDRHVF